MFKIALGTVQFGITYGINNKSGVPDDKELSSIFKLANNVGIKILDTAQSYGNAEERIGELAEDNFKVITKFKNLESSFPFYDDLNMSLKKLNVNSLYGYMAHDADGLIENPTWWKGMKILKDNGLIQKIGYSLYSISQLDLLISKQLIPDIIQVPYNILDKRFEPYFFNLKEMGVEIHTRSVFHQGLYFMKPEKLPSKLSSFLPIIHKLNIFSKEFGVPIGAIALKYVLHNPHIDKVVVGVDSVLQLKQNTQLLELAELPNQLINEINSIIIEDKNLLSPTNW